METRTTIKLDERLSKGLIIVQQEIEELALQFALGKAEASDKFEDIKNEFNAKVIEWKSAWLNVKISGNVKLERKLNELLVQLTLGKAEAKELFEEQKNKILHALSELELEMNNKPELKYYLNEFKSETEKFKLKLEIVKLKFALKIFEVKDSFKNEMRKAKIEIDKIVEKIDEKLNHTKEKYSGFKNELDLAYLHLKRAIQSL